ncbi:MAG TPA: TrkA C-terminal domain-containing protein, partial [Candidatus Methylomirabilis sp.]
IGKTMQEIDIHNRAGLVVIAIGHSGEDGYAYNPKASTELRAGDVLIICGETAQLEALQTILASG